MVALDIRHTSELDADTRAAARELLYVVFDDMTEHDWEHSLGGLHALVMDGARVVGHAAIVQRRLLYGGRALRAGYVEGVAVHPEHRRRPELHYLALYSDGLRHTCERRDCSSKRPRCGASRP